MDVYSLSRPLSPGSVEVFSRYTTILDDETLMHEAIALPDDFQTDPLVPQDVLASSLNSSLSPQTSKNQLINHPPRNKNHERTSIESEPNFAEDTLAGFSCFYAGTGEPTKTPRRAPLSAQKKSKVWDIRKRGACLRCILLKRECSGGIPCKLCVEAVTAAKREASKGFARKAKGSLRWMASLGCQLPGLSSVNVFEKGDYRSRSINIDHTINSLLQRDICLDFPLPFDMDIDDISASFAQWLLADDAVPPDFSMVGFLSTAGFSHVIGQTLGQNISCDSRLFVWLTTLLFMQKNRIPLNSGDCGFQTVHGHLGYRLVLALDKLLKPQKLRALDRHSNELKSIFLLILSITIAIVYSMDIMCCTLRLEAQFEALLRRLCYHIVWIAQEISLMPKDSKEVFLVSDARYRWRKPGRFFWQDESPLPPNNDPKLHPQGISRCDDNFFAPRNQDHMPQNHSDNLTIMRVCKSRSAGLKEALTTPSCSLVEKLQEREHNYICDSYVSADDYERLGIPLHVSAEDALTVKRRVERGGPPWVDVDLDCLLI